MSDYSIFHFRVALSRRPMRTTLADQISDAVLGRHQSAKTNSHGFALRNHGQNRCPPSCGENYLPLLGRLEEFWAYATSSRTVATPPPTLARR